MIIKNLDIAESAQDVWDAFSELRGLGFDEDQAIKLVGIALMHTNRKAFK
ncbi:hypothetical protein [Nonomuraea sp. NPDC049129]